MGMLNRGFSRIAALLAGMGAVIAGGANDALTAAENGRRGLLNVISDQPIGSKRGRAQRFIGKRDIIARRHGRKLQMVSQDIFEIDWKSLERNKYAPWGRGKNY